MKTTINDLIHAKGVSEPLRQAVLMMQEEMLKIDAIATDAADLNDRQAKRIDELTKQRDELLAALEKCRKELSAWMRDHGDDIATQEAVADARAAIASVKGEQ